MLTVVKEPEVNTRDPEGMSIDITGRRLESRAIGKLTAVVVCTVILN
jgi:hypothetical protein